MHAKKLLVRRADLFIELCCKNDIMYPGDSQKGTPSSWGAIINYKANFSAG